MAKISMKQAEEFMYYNMKEKHKQRLKDCAEKDKEGLIHKIKTQFIEETKRMKYINKPFRSYLEEITKEISEQETK